jgi:predicted metal-binding protein
MAIALDSAEQNVTPALLTKHDGHPFAASTSSAGCAICGESSVHILHHPTRIRAACALLGIDPEPLLARSKR